MNRLMTVGTVPAPDYHGQRLLIVDDEPLMRSGLCHHLAGEGRTILECGTGAEAIALIKSQDIELVLLDINLPDISGLEILEWVTINRKSVSVILVSGDDRIESAIRALRHGAVEFVRKPYEVDDILHKVDSILHKRLLERNNVLMAARLEQSERLHRFLVESSPDIIYTWTRRAVLPSSTGGSSPFSDSPGKS